MTSESNIIFRSARTSYRASVRPVPSTRPATIFPEFIDELKHCHQASGTPQIVYFLKADDVSYPNSDENTNTKTNTGTNTNTETNKGKTNDTYDVIYFRKEDDKRFLNIICGRQHLRKYKDKDKHKHKDKYKNNRPEPPAANFSLEILSKI